VYNFYFFNPTDEMPFPDALNGSFFEFPHHRCANLCSRYGRKSLYLLRRDLVVWF